MNAPLSVENIAVSVRNLDLKEVALQEAARIKQQELARLAVELTEVERFILRKDEVLAALNNLQIKAQEKNKGLFETLLTNLVREIIPGKNDEVVLTSSLKNNRASLDFDIRCDGELMNIDQDKGGSIANIVSMGLRFIVLARHPNRRVLLLDEADCHLKSEYIPAFAAVMRQLAVKMGIQVIYISHHAPSNFVGYGRVHEIYSDGRKTHSRTLHEESEEDRNIESMSAFRYVRLRDYGPHENLLVDLSPGLNVITGDIDTGKSKVLSAIVDLLANNGEERRIRHKRPYFDVEIGLEEGMTLNWQYQRKGSKRTQLTLKNESGEVIETSDLGQGIPDWLDMYLSMPMVNGENIHYQSQKKINYLLSSQDYTSIKRAEMLPLGRESRDVNRMIQIYKDRLAQAREDFRRLSKEMNNVKNELAIMAPVLDEPIDMEAIHEGLDAIRTLDERSKSMLRISGQIEGLQRIHTDIQALIDGLADDVMDEVKLKCTPTMRQSIIDYKNASERHAILSEVDDLISAPVEPVLHNIAGIRKAGIEIGGLQNLLALRDELKGIEQPADVALKATTAMEESIRGISKATESKTLHSEKIKLNGQQRESLATAKAALYEKMGGVCPTCDKPLEGHAHD